MNELANQKHSIERRCILKPRFEMGDEVYATWMGASRAGRVMSYREVASTGETEDNGDGAYDPIRIYQIKFDSEPAPLPKVAMAMAGSVIDGIPEHVVVSKKDYLLSTSHCVAHEWKGIRNVVDASSDDLWAKYVGWYAVAIGGRGDEAGTEQFFPRLSDAVRAYDSSVVRIKGDKTKRDELNFPEAWDWLLSTNGTVEHDEELQLKKENLQYELDYNQKKEKELAIKVALDEERLKHLNIQIKLRDEQRERYNKEIVATKKIYEEEKALAMEKARGELLLQHQYEKERLRAELKEYYEDKKAKAVEEAKAKLWKEMQLEIDHEKEKALNWLRDKVMQQQRQQQEQQQHQQHQQQQRKPEAGAQGLGLTNKALGRARNDDVLEFLTAPKRVKLVKSDSDSDSHADAASGFMVASLATEQGKTMQGESMDVEDSPNENCQLPLLNGTASCLFGQQAKHVPADFLMLPLPLSLPPPTPCLTVAQAKAENSANRRAAANKEPNKELHGHCTAVEALLFAAEKVESRVISADSWTADPSTEESVPAVSTTTTIKKKKKPKRIMDESRAIEPTEDDVLFGRGGYVNTHPGNIHFREKALELRPWYEASTKEEKYNISKVLIESVKGQGHRFLEKASDGLWHEVSGNGVRKKASQALRERVRGKMTMK
ncbi:hypothetical protein ACHAW5_006464 [Stephanodiscus triporus]|uniref:DUF6824 domain-containing protein n=1 Tax=Stephanodiscus triporus TaxID=2934178 RepID=A0ABD3P1L6_9STRA